MREDDVGGADVGLAQEARALRVGGGGGEGEEGEGQRREGDGGWAVGGGGRQGVAEVRSGGARHRLGAPGWCAGVVDELGKLADGGVVARGL